MLSIGLSPPNSAAEPARQVGLSGSDEDVRALFHASPAAWGAALEASDDDAIDLTQNVDELRSTTPAHLQAQWMVQRA